MVEEEQVKLTIKLKDGRIRSCTYPRTIAASVLAAARQQPLYAEAEAEIIDTPQQPKETPFHERFIEAACIGTTAGVACYLLTHLGLWAAKNFIVK